MNAREDGDQRPEVRMKRAVGEKGGEGQSALRHRYTACEVLVAHAP